MTTAKATSAVAREVNRARRWIPTGVLLAAIAAMLLHGPIAQPGDYHAFADNRSPWGIANAADVLSNLGFAIVGFAGLWALRGRHDDPSFARSWPGYRLFLWALVLTAIGSGYYHLAPDNARLFWDRVPIALACAGLLAGARAETRDIPQSVWITPMLAAAGVASVMWWSFTESRGAGDLRPYLLLQGAPLLLIPIWQALHHSPVADRVAFAVAILLYAGAKIAEVNDRNVYEALGGLSGHTLKHLLAIAAGAVLAWNLARKVRAPPGPAAP